MNNSQKVTVIVMTVIGLALVVNQVINDFNFVL